MSMQRLNEMSKGDQSNLRRRIFHNHDVTTSRIQASITNIEKEEQILTN